MAHGGGKRKGPTLFKGGGESFLSPFMEERVKGKSSIEGERRAFFSLKEGKQLLFLRRGRSGVGGHFYLGEKRGKRERSLSFSEGRRRKKTSYHFPGKRIGDFLEVRGKGKKEGGRFFPFGDKKRKGRKEVALPYRNLGGQEEGKGVRFFLSPAKGGRGGKGGGIFRRHGGLKEGKAA